MEVRVFSAAPFNVIPSPQTVAVQAYCVMCAWRVDQMVDHLNVSYLYKKRGVFYFTKRVPCDVKSYYKSDRIVICLRTKSNVSAVRASKSLYQRLDDYWASIRLTKMQVPTQHMLVSKPPVNSNSNAPLLSEALSRLFEVKGCC